MQAVNHVVAGSLIAAVVPEPAISLPLSLGSHFVMDALPHYGNDHKAPRGSKLYVLRIVIDAILSTLIVWFLATFHVAHPAILMLGAFFAVMPDLLWPLAFFVKRSGPIWQFFVWHKIIQRESRPGIWFELVFFITIFTLTLNVIKATV